MIQVVLAKVVGIKQEVDRFRQIFQLLFQRGFPNFRDAEGKLIFEDQYKELLIKVRSDHAKFDDLEKGLKGEVVLSKLREDFEINTLFKSIKFNLSAIAHGPLVELDVMVEEMMNVEVPLDVIWKKFLGVRS